jgi:hypothetical protein
MHVGNQKENQETLQIRITKRLCFWKSDLASKRSCLSNFFSFAQDGDAEQVVNFGFYREQFLKKEGQRL